MCRFDAMKESSRLANASDKRRFMLICGGPSRADGPDTEPNECRSRRAPLRARLEGRDFDTAGLRETLRAAPAAAKFFDPAADWAPERDFELCTAVDRFVATAVC